MKVDAQRLELSRREFDLLAALVANRDIVLSRVRLLEMVWGYDFDLDTNVVDVFVGYLRRKLQACGAVDVIAHRAWRRVRDPHVGPSGLITVRLATRTSIAAALAAALSLTVLGVVVRGRVQVVLRQRVDRQLEERAATAPLLAAVGDRLARSELGDAIEGARIRTGAQVVEIGSLPEDGLPPVRRLGFRTVRADGELWRLLTVPVPDVPEVGDRSLVQLAAPMGNVEALARSERRAISIAVILGVIASAIIGYLFGLVASRPLAKLRRDAGNVGARSPDGWRMSDHYGAAEVDEVAAVLNQGLDQVAAETVERQAALDAARAFTASAAHELRTPLTGALTHLDVAQLERDDGVQRDAHIEDGREQLMRMAATLTALRSLADADLVDPTWFSPLDLTDLVAVVVEQEARRHGAIDLRLDAPEGELTVNAWADGVALACSNLVRNAVVHGSPANGTPVIRVTVRREQGGLASVTVEDNGPGIPMAERARVTGPFQRGSGSQGSGLGLAIVAQVARAHHGELTIGDSQLGGARLRVDDPGRPERGHQAVAVAPVFARAPVQAPLVTLP